jgi:dTDP-4-dehydrorhamnose reductase
MKVLITGKGGQLAWELERLAPQAFEIISVGIEQLDISNENDVADFIAATKPDLVINAAAYTAVDHAEKDSVTAYAVNELGVKYLAQACKKINARILHISTDFIFDGTSTRPYQTDAKPNPLNVYGTSKLAGDKALNEILPQASVIVRTAWVYSANGNNFVKSMLRLMQENRNSALFTIKLVPRPGRKGWRNGCGLLPLNRKSRARTIGRMPVLPPGMILPLQSKSLL